MESKTHTTSVGCPAPASWASLAARGWLTTGVDAQTSSHAGPQTKMKYHVLLVFDDIVVTQRYEALEFLATAGRHHSITVVLLSQISNNAISPIIRTNVDYVFWRKLGKLALQNNIFPYMSISEFQDYHQLHDFTLNSTSDYRFVFYNNSTDEASEKIKLVRAQDLPDGFQYKLADPKPKRKSHPMIKW